MSGKFRLPIIIGSVITLIIVAAVFGSVVMAQDDGDRALGINEGQASPSMQETPVPGGPGFVSVNSYALQPNYPGEQYHRFGQLLYCRQAYCQFSAGINLPHGVTVTKLVAYYYDNSGDDIHVGLLRGH